MNFTDLETPEVQLARLLEALRNPIGIFVALALIVTLVVLASGRRTKWTLVGLLLFFAPMMIAIAPGLRFAHAITPFHQFRTYGRPICGALLLLMLIPTFTAPRGWRLHIVPFAAIAYLIFELIFSIRNIAGGSPLRGTISIGIFLLIFVVLGFGLSKWLQDLKDMRAATRAIAAGTLIFAICTAIQLVINRSVMIQNGRLFGLTGNPQQVGMLIGGSFPAVALLCVWKDEVKALRILWMALAAAMVLMLTWSGSRTGGMMTVIGLSLLFRRHIGRMLGFLIVCTVLVFVVLQTVELDVQRSSTHLLSISNSRQEVWARMLQDFLSSPLWGIPEKEAFGSESSYLATAARMGVIGLIPLVILLVSCFTSVVRLHLNRKLLREHAFLVDLVIAGFGAMFGGAFFEGFLLGVLAHQVFLIYIYLAMMRFLLDVAEYQATQAQFAPEYAEEEYTYPTEEFAGHVPATF
jgi:hypothetical protein